MRTFVVIIIVLIVAIMVGGLVGGLGGIHISTGDGSHVGFITAVQTNGLIFKTMRAYVKTDTQSSQEDKYCVVDTKVYSDLQKAAASHSRVEVTYFSWLASGVQNCDGETDIISGVKTL